MSSRLLKSITAGFFCLCLCPLLVRPGFAQEEGGDEPPPPPTTQQGPLKSWYPRLSDLPYSPFDEDTVIINGGEYQSRSFRVTFFADTPPEVMDAVQKQFTTEAVYKSSDGHTFQIKLQDPDQLLVAVDAFNDLDAVQGAWLMRIDGSTSVTPTPFPGGPTSTDEEGSKGVEALRPGDVNKDGVWNVMDAVLTLRVIVALDSFDPYATSQADINRTGKPDVEDAVNILRLALGMGLPRPYGYGGSTGVSAQAY